MKIVDVVINIDSLLLKEEESVEDLINCIREKYQFGYDPTWEVLYEESIEE